MPTWTQAIAVGHPLIDQQHKELFARADDLLEAMAAGRAGDELEELLAFLRDYVRVHFATEEKLMAEKKYAGLFAHKGQHEEFERRFREDEEGFKRRGSTSMIVLDLRDLIRGWLVDHVCSVDRALARFLEQQAVSSTDGGSRTRPAP